MANVVVHTNQESVQHTGRDAQFATNTTILQEEKSHVANVVVHTNQESVQHTGRDAQFAINTTILQEFAVVKISLWQHAGHQPHPTRKKEFILLLMTMKSQNQS